jgi:hypothetical protein
MIHNAPLADGPLFVYRNEPDTTGCQWLPMTRSAFLARLKAVCDELEVVAPNGHSLRIGGTLEYLLCNIAFDVVKTMGRWSSNAFQMHLREHPLILVPYLQARPHLEAQFARAMMPRCMRAAARQHRNTEASTVTRKEHSLRLMGSAVFCVSTPHVAMLLGVAGRQVLPADTAGLVRTQGLGPCPPSHALVLFEA